MNHPFFNVKELDDDTINKKILQLQGRLLYTQAFSGNSMMMDQMFLMLETLEAEREERYQLEVFKAYNKQFPDVIESDPEFKQKDTGKGGTNADGKPKVERPKVQPVFTKQYKKK
jgi:hypothetical protein